MTDTVSDLSNKSRLLALTQSGLMDSAPEEVFDRATALASSVLDTPVSLLSLVDAERQFFKAQKGLKGWAAKDRQTPLSHSFCQYVVTDAKPLRIVDARSDTRLTDNLAIKELDVIGYLGVPIRSSCGTVLGSLCAISPNPRDWSNRDLDHLEGIARGVESEIELREALFASKRQSRHIQGVLDELPLGVAIAKVPTGAVSTLNEWGQAILHDAVHISKSEDYLQLGAQHVSGARYKVDEYPLLRAAKTGEHVVNEPMLYRCNNGSLIDLEVSAKRLDADNTFAIATFVDVTDRKQAEGSAEEARRQLMRVLEGTIDPVVVMTHDWVITYINKAARNLFFLDREVVGRDIWTAYPDWTDGPLRTAFHTAMNEGLPCTADIEVDDPPLCFEARIFPGQKDLTVYFRNVTVERQAVTARQLLMFELNHRIKNLFTVLSSMVSLTARTAQSPDMMAKTLRARISAMSRAHDFVAPAVANRTDDSKAIAIQTLIASLIAPHAGLESDQVTYEGPEFFLGPNGATNLALVLHELATNAAKYGALSNLDGRLQIRWSESDSTILLTWSEFGGPTITTPPDRTGFGSTLIKSAINGPLGGDIQTQWRSEGAHFEVRMAAAQLKA